MKFVVLFEDNPETDQVTRLSYLPLHQRFLRRNAGAIAAAGELAATDDQNGGGLWVIDAENEAEVARYVREDPFWPTGLRKSVRILKWQQIQMPKFHCPLESPILREAL